MCIESKRLKWRKSGASNATLDVDGHGYAGQQIRQSQDGRAKDSHLHLPYYVSGESAVPASLARPGGHC